MSLENITLPVETLSGLYGKHLYIIPSTTIVPKQEKTPPAPAAKAAGKPGPTVLPAYLGGNKRRVLILVDNEGAAHINTEELDTLTRILTACKLTLDDVAIMNVAGHTLPWPVLQQQLAPGFCILFNVSSAAIDLPMVFPSYHQHQYGGCQFLLSDGLPQITANALLKSKLWLCLKAMFGV